MNKCTINLGRWFGYPIYLHWSWTIYILFGLFIDPGNVPFRLGLFCIILLHELGHCWAARQCNWAVSNVTLYPFGGLAHIDMKPRPKDELFVILCGPAVNVFLMLPLMSLPKNEICAKLEVVNIVILIFNLLPLFPLDGGRIFKAILELIGCQRLTASKIAVRTSWVGWAIMTALAILTVNIMLLIICVLMILIGYAETKMEQQRAWARPWPQD